MWNRRAHRCGLAVRTSPSSLAATVASVVLRVATSPPRSSRPNPRLHSARGASCVCCASSMNVRTPLVRWASKRTHSFHRKKTHNPQSIEWGVEPRPAKLEIAPASSPETLPFLCAAGPAAALLAATRWVSRSCHSCSAERASLSGSS